MIIRQFKKESKDIIKTSLSEEEFEKSNSVIYILNNDVYSNIISYNTYIKVTREFYVKESNKRISKLERKRKFKKILTHFFNKLLPLILDIIIISLLMTIVF